MQVCYPLRQERHPSVAAGKLLVVVPYRGDTPYPLNEAVLQTGRQQKCGYACSDRCKVPPWQTKTRDKAWVLQGKGISDQLHLT